MQLPLPLHTSVPPQDVPAVMFEYAGVPAEQLSVVQALLSLDMSLLLSLVVVPPAPLQTAVLQSPAVWAASGVFNGAKLTPQTPAVQVRVEHSVSLPGH
jgi:hypothetical protein